MGFSMVGFEIVAGIDIEKSFLETFKNTHKNATVIREDLSKCEVKEVLIEHGVDFREIDIIIGGPPCQGFSTVGNRAINDPRNKLVGKFAKAVKDLNPPIFLMENVHGLISMKNENGTHIIDELLKAFEDMGYLTSYNVLLAADYGVPQMRKRLFIVGVRKDLNLSFNWPERTHVPKNFILCHIGKFKPYITVRDAISDLPPLSPGEEASEYATPPKTEYQKWAREGATKLTNHKVPKHSGKVIERIKHIPEGGNHSDLPDHLKLKGGYPNIYGRLKWDAPASTITANFGCVSAPGRFIHPRDHRVLSVREGARLQSFPDRVQFFGSLSQQYRQVGNAVPPLLAKALAESIKSILTSI